MRFKHILGECDSKEWISPKLIEAGGKAYWIVLQILNLEGITGEEIFVSRLAIVIPEIAGDRWKGDYSPESEEEAAGMIYEYGCSAHVWSEKGKNPLELMLQAVKQAINIPEYFDEYMDEPQNRLGWNGWKFCSGM